MRGWAMSSAGGCIEILHNERSMRRRPDLAVAYAVSRVELDNNHISRFYNLGGHAPATAAKPPSRSKGPRSRLLRLA